MGYYYITTSLNSIWILTHWVSLLDQMIESAKPGWQYPLFNFLLLFWICFPPLKPSSLCRQNSNAGRFAIDKFLNHVMRLMMMRRRRRGRRRRRLVIKMGMIGDETGDGVPRTCRHVVVWETRPTKTRGGVFCICLPQLCAVHALLIVYHLMFGYRFKKSFLFCSREWQLHNRNQIAWKWNLRRWLILQGAQSVSNPPTWIFELHPIASLTATWGSDAVAGRWEEGSRCHIKSAPHLCLHCFVQFKWDITYQFEFHLNLDSLSFFARPDYWVCKAWMTIPTFQFSTFILNLLPPFETLKLVQAKLQRRQVLWRDFEVVNWLACNSSWPWFCSREWQLQNRRIAWKWSLRGWWILPGAQDYFKYLFLLFQLFPNWCCKCLWVRLPWGSDGHTGCWWEASRCGPFFKTYFIDLKWHLLKLYNFHALLVYNINDHKCI